MSSDRGSSSSSSSSSTAAGSLPMKRSVGGVAVLSIGAALGLEKSGKWQLATDMWLALAETLENTKQPDNNAVSKADVEKKESARSSSAELESRALSAAEATAAAAGRPTSVSLPMAGFTSSECGQIYWRVGNRYYWGWTVRSDIFKAEYYWQKSAQFGHPGGRGWAFMRALADLEQDANASANAFHSLVQQGVKSDEYADACVVYAQNGHCVSASDKLSKLRAGSSLGHPVAMAELAHALGSSAQASEERKLEAFELASKSALQKCPAGMNVMGLYLKNGVGVKSDFKEALRWMRSAALELDFAPALSNLGLWYWHGHCGLAQDEGMALRLFESAAEKGNIPCVRTTANIYDAGVPGKVEPNPTKALKWLKVLVNCGDVDAAFKVGDYHERGLAGLQRDPAEAAKYYCLAAQEGHEMAQRRYDLIRSGLSLIYT